MAKKMAVTLNKKVDLDVAVYPFYNKAKKQTDLSRLISDDFSVYLAQNTTQFKLIERSFLEQMMQEHQLNEEGLIDPRTAKEFGMIIAADAYITGKTMVLSTYVRLHIFAIHTQTGERIYSDYKKIPLDHDIAEFVGINDLKERKEKENMHKSTDKDCAKRQVGDFCFINKTRNRLTIKVQANQTNYATSHRSLSVQINEKKCFKSLPANISYNYIAKKSQIFIGEIIPKGEFFVKTCTSDYIIVR